MTIIPSTSGAGGVTFIQPEWGKTLFKEKTKRTRYGSLWWPRCRVFTFNEDWNEITTGASSDIEQATRLLHAMVDIYGMSDNSLVNMTILKNNSTSEKSMEYIVKLSEELKNETVGLMKK